MNHTDNKQGDEMMTISVRIKQNAVTTQWGMFLSVGAAQVYMKEQGYKHYEILRGNRVVYVQ